LNCQRGTPIKTEEYFAGQKRELSCELFSCGVFDENGKRFDTLLHFATDSERYSNNGPGTEGPYLYAVHNENETKSLKIKKISSNKDLLYSSSSFRESLDRLPQALKKLFAAPLLSDPDSWVDLAKAAGVSSIAPELQAPLYQNHLESLAFNCDGIQNVWGRLRSHYLSVKSVVEKQSAVLLVEKVSGVLRTRLAPPSSVLKEMCHLGGDTYVRPDAVADLPSLLLKARQINPVSEDEARSLFREVAAMPDIPHEFSAFGCEARAHIVAERLKEKGYSVQKIWAVGGGLSPYKGQNDVWDFHVATAIPVRVGNGNIEWRVLDPTLANEPVDTNDWLRRFQPNAGGSGVWTQWPLSLAKGPTAKTIVYLSSPDVYSSEDNDEPSEEKRARNRDTAWQTIGQMRTTLEDIRSHPNTAYGELRPPDLLVDKEASP